MPNSQKRYFFWIKTQNFHFTPFLNFCRRFDGWKSWIGNTVGGVSEIFFQFVLAELKTQANMKFDYKAETQLDALTHALCSSGKERGNERRRREGVGCDLWQVCQLIITSINFIQASFNCPHFYRELSRVLQRGTAKERGGGVERKGEGNCKRKREVALFDTGRSTVWRVLLRLRREPFTPRLENFLHYASRRQL